MLKGEDNDAEEIPNLENTGEYITEDRRVDSSLYYILSVMSLLRAQFQRDYSWVFWAFKRVTDI